MDNNDEFEEQGDAAASEAPQRGRRRRAEGVRIIGAEEAARALKEGQAAGRRPDDAPRFGDVPKRPSGPKPAQRFPLPEAVDPAEAVVRPPVAGGGPELPHWTDPPTGEVPRIFDDGPDDGEDLDAWSGLAARAPRWRDQDSDWDNADLQDVASLVDDDDDVRLGALDEDRSEHSDLFSFDEPEPVARTERAAPVTTSIRTRQPAPADPVQPPSGGQRDMRSAVAIGAAMAAVALILFKAGPKPTLLLVTAIVTLAAGEAYDVLRRAGYRPATLLGLCGTVALMIATYSERQIAMPVIVIAVIFTFLWYLFGVVRARPMVNAAVTLFVFFWIGVLGSFAALLLSLPDRRGIAFLLAAVVATVAYDVGGLFFGSQMGSRPLAPDVSPNKTMEGLIGGMASSVFATVVLIGVLPGIHPWTSGKALVLGLTVAVVAPLGDLCESMLKRDLGVKDMGSILPGHGGVLDRFDALLFVLPATYYLVHLLDLA